MINVYMMIGPSGSGKSTKAKELMETNTAIRRLSRDDTRAQLAISSLHNIDRSFEGEVTLVSDDMSYQMIRRGHDIIVDNTNLTLDVLKEWKQKLSLIAIATNQSIKMIPVWPEDDLTLAKCLDRQHRASRNGRVVPEDVVTKQWHRYNSIKDKDLSEFFDVVMEPLVPYYAHMSMEPVVICDLDGTLAIMNDRNPFSPVGLETDDVNGNLLLILESLCNRGMRLMFFSGRDDGHFREGTELWLKNHVKPHIKTYDLYMRADNDFRPDWIIKKEIFDRVIRKNNLRPVAVFDDRKQVCIMWNALGLPLFRVGNPLASF